jgi:hypothetical protein
MAYVAFFPGQDALLACLLRHELERTAAHDRSVVSCTVTDDMVEAAGVRVHAESEAHVRDAIARALAWVREHRAAVIASLRTDDASDRRRFGPTTLWTDDGS